jgi:acyl-homoserine-lactone acylase
MTRLVFTLILAAIGLAAAPKAEILWDRYGVAHIYSNTLEGMAYAHGYAQIENHADLLLRLYGESRGRGAEYWGEEKLALDRWVHTNNVPALARRWYAQQTPAFRRYLDAFADGINAHYRAHPNHPSAQYRQVLPVSGVDVVQHTLRAVHFMYMGSMNRMRAEVSPLVGPRTRAALERAIPDPPADAGSNTWAVGPSRSASGKPLLIINPHLAWEDFYSYMEVHLVGPNYDLYGAPQIGFPTPVVGFNRHTGWGRTVNTIDTVDFYQLTVRDGKYEFDGGLRDFQARTAVIRVRLKDGSYRDETLRTLESVHGPVVFQQQDVTVAMRVAGLDRPRMLEQWFLMGQAKNLDEFRAAMRLNAVPMWNANYADDQGHIWLVCNGVIPRRSKGDWAYWSKPVPGNTSTTLWTDYLKLEELPQSLDPPSGFHQNANEQPWFTTLPTLDPAKYPAYVAPTIARAPTFRTKRSLRMISEDKSITYAELLAYKHDTRVELADAVLPDLIRNAGRLDDELTKRAMMTLQTWDRHFEVNSRGAVLFHLFADKFFGTGDFIEQRLQVKYDPAAFLNSLHGIADVDAAYEALRAAAQECLRVYGALDVPYGDVFRFERGGVDLPGNGGAGRMGLFRTMTFSKRRENRLYPSHGETFVCAIEFGSPQQAQCLLGYGNASQAGSKHVTDQLPLMVEKKLHPVWRERADVERNLERKEELR